MLRKIRFPPIAMRATELAFALVFLAAIVHHVSRGDFKPLVAMTLPLLVVFYGFASVLFVRGRALASGRWQTEPQGLPYSLGDLSAAHCGAGPGWSGRAGAHAAAPML